MRYLIAVLVPLLLQCLFVFIVIEMNTGNGSFVGLGAFLLGIIAIPITAIINAVYVRVNPELGIPALVLRSFMIAAIVPILTVV